MRKLTAAALLSLLPAACAASPEPAPPRVAAGAPAQPARDLAQELFGALARQLEARAGRIVATREHRQGLGGVLTHIDLYEAPRPSGLAGLCEVTVHDVAMGFVAPGDPARPEPRSVRTFARWFAIGDPPADGGNAADMQSGCAAADPKLFFDAPSSQSAQEALRTLRAAQAWSQGAPAALVLSCTRYGEACPDPGSALRGLDLAGISTITETRCPPEPPFPGPQCWSFAFGPDGGSPGWTVTVRGPRRPLKVELRLDPPPVT